MNVILVLVQVVSLFLVFVFVQIWIKSDQDKSNQILRLNLGEEGRARAVCDLLRRFAHKLRREAI